MAAIVDIRPLTREQLDACRVCVLHGGTLAPSTVLRLIDQADKDAR